jgi:hypothetical protein
MNTQREVFNKLFKEEKTELATQKIELAMDFDSILKDLKKDVANSNKQVAQMSKHAKAFIQAKNPDRSGVAKGRASKVSSFFKDYSKKANDLGIDVKKTMFYKEYLNALDFIGQLNKDVDDVKSILKSVK